MRTLGQVLVPTRTAERHFPEEVDLFFQRDVALGLCLKLQFNIPFKQKGKKRQQPTPNYIVPASVRSGSGFESRGSLSSIPIYGNNNKTGQEKAQPHLISLLELLLHRTTSLEHQPHHYITTRVGKH